MTILMTTLQGFKNYIEAEDPDILVLNETKVRYTYGTAFKHAS